MIDRNWPILPMVLLIGTLLVTGYTSDASAQVPALPDQYGRVAPPSGPVSRFLEGGMPGLTNPAYPFLNPPVMRAELKVKPLFIFTTGKVENSATGQKADWRGGLGLRDRQLVMETMVRWQISRLSFRFQYDWYIQDFSEGVGRLEWPEYRLGVDYDILDGRSFRLGFNLDAYPDYPKFHLTGSPLGTTHFVSARPATGGIHFVFNPPDIGRISVSFEARGRRSLRTATRVDEVDLAGGVKTPETVLGSVALRGGWRYTTVELANAGYDVNLNWSAIFGELIYYY